MVPIKMWTKIRRPREPSALAHLICKLFIRGVFFAWLVNGQAFASGAKQIPRPGIEPGSSAWQAEILTTILSRMLGTFNLWCALRIACKQKSTAWKYNGAVVLDAWPNISTLGHCASGKIVMKQKICNYGKVSSVAYGYPGSNWRPSAC